jgi:hypothetical protein
MKELTFFYKNVMYFFILSLLIFSCKQDVVVINDSNGVLGKTHAPVFVDVELNESQLLAVKEGRLTFVESFSGKSVPVQLETNEAGEKSGVILILPEGKSDTYSFKIVEIDSPIEHSIEASLNTKNSQAVIVDNNKIILQYNYQTVYEKDVIRPDSKKDDELSFSIMSGVYYEEYLKAHPELQRNDTTTSRIYSIPRSDYIHPLYGLNGEMLTNDWPDGGHPHHRGIFWAWPEVEYKSQRADIYALQRVFARPTGKIEFTSGAVFAEIDAENMWMWEDREAIVNEQAIIRVYHATNESRIIDLTIKLLAVKDSVTIATRFTNSYGGLNIRMQSPKNQDISYFTDEEGAEPRRAWSDFNGIFEGSITTSGLMVLQNNQNPEYPGEWRDYPGLAWVQPTFPTPNTRYLLSKTEPLILRYRLIIHNGGKPGKKISEANWDAYNLPETPVNEIGE